MQLLLRLLRVDVVRKQQANVALLRRDPKAPSMWAYRKLVRQPVDREVLTTVSEWIRRVSGEG